MSITQNPGDGTFGEIDESHPPIKPRRVTFDWERTPLHWIPGDPLASHIINSFHIILPAGERWFVEVVRSSIPELHDERLLAEIKGFIGQEVVYARSHQGVLDQLLERSGIDVSKMTDAADKGTADRPALMARLAAKSPRRARRRQLLELGAVAAIEHYTAVLGQWIIDNHRLDADGADPTMLDLLRWHGAEEVEHRSVVFDVYKAMGGGYGMRVFSWAVSLSFLYAGLVGGALYLMRHDPSIGRIRPLRVYLAYRRSVRQRHVPGILRLLFGQAPVYLRPSHHPSKVCSTPEALAYILRSPAAQAAGYTPY